MMLAGSQIVLERHAQHALHPRRAEPGGSLLRSRSGAFVRIILLALALTLSAAYLGAAAPASAGSGADPSGSAQALRALRAAEQQLTAGDGAAGDFFGASVAISGATAVVGAPNDDVAANADQGSAYVFTRSGSTWTPQQKLTAADGAAYGSFGVTVAISGDTVVIGATTDNLAQGSAYVFTRSGSTWSQQGNKLTAGDGAAGDRFGNGVAISGDTVVVGAGGHTVGENLGQGSAYVFTRSGSTWSQQQKLTAADGAANDYFGNAVAISGDTVVVGAYGDGEDTNESQGSAYVFTRSGSTWSQQRKLTAGDGAANDYFGLSVAVSGDTVVVGAPWKIVGVKADQGSAYVFTRSGGTWSRQAKLTAADGRLFGHSVAIAGATVVAGAFLDNVAFQGCTYVYTRSGARWSRHERVTAADGAGDTWINGSVAISGATVVAGAPHHVGVNENQGSASVFRISRPGRPVARSPKGSISSRMPIFRWTRASGAAVYQVRIYKGSRLLKRQSGLTKTAWKCTKRLPRQAWLTWKVRARNVAGYGAWSAKLRFRVR